MNVTPTSGPIASSSTHHARDVTSSRYSLRRSHAIALCERKEDLFEIVTGCTAAGGGERREFLQRPLTARATAAQQDEAIADARRVANLVDRQEHRPAGGRVRTQRLRDVAALAEVDAVERFVGEEQRLRHQQANREKRALPLAFRQAADGRVEQRFDREPPHHFVPQVEPATEKSQREIDCPAHGLRRPGDDLIGKIEEARRTLAISERPAVANQRALVERQGAAPALEKRPLSRSVRADEAQDLALADRERHIIQCGEPAVALREVSNLQQPSSCSGRGRLLPRAVDIKTGLRN